MKKAFRNNVLTSAIAQLDKIAAVVQKGEFDVADSEEKHIEAINKSNHPSSDLLLATHFCRMGHLFYANKKWDAAKKSFDNGIYLFKLIPEDQLTHDHRIFFTRSAYLLAKTLKYLPGDVDAARALQMLIIALDTFFAIDNQTIEDQVYLVFYFTQILYFQLYNDMHACRDALGDLTPTQEKDLWSFIINNTSFRKLEADLHIEPEYEASVANDLFIDTASKILRLSQSALRTYSAFKPAPQITDQPKAESRFTYTYTLRPS